MSVYHTLQKIKEQISDQPQWREDYFPLPEDRLQELIAKGFIENVSTNSRGQRWFKLTEKAHSQPPPPIELPEDFLSTVYGLEPEKKILRRALLAKRPVHVLLIGKPASAKTQILLETARIPGAKYITGRTTTLAGLLEVLFTEPPEILIIDEIDKMRFGNIGDYTPLLSIMQTGLLVEEKAGKHRETLINTRVMAGGIQREKLPIDLLSRFLIIHLQRYDTKTFIQTAKQVLVKNEAIPEDLAEHIINLLAGKTEDIRDAVKIARLSNTIEEADEAAAIYFMNHY